MHRVLTRYGLARPRWLVCATGLIRRIESLSCGDMAHVDVKELGKIPAGGGWRMLGSTVGGHTSSIDRSSGVFNA